MRARWLATWFVFLVALTAAFEQPRTAAAAPGFNAVSGSAGAAESLSEATGLAISPLLVLAGTGVYRYYEAEPEARNNLPWFASVWFWVPALILILLVLLKEVILGRFIVLKKPLDELELVENKISGLLACPVAVAALAAVLEPKMSEAVAWSAHVVLPVAHAASAGSVGTTSVVGLVSWGAAVAGGLVLFAAVWMVSHAVNVLLLLSPFGLIDNVVKGFRLLALAILFALARYFPAGGLILCVLLFAVALWLAGWSFRLLVFGAVFSMDVLLGRKVAPADGALTGFSSQRRRGLPARTYGVLRRTARGLEFVYRPWLVLRKRSIITSPEQVEIATALLSPIVVKVKDPGEYETLETIFRVPPRYRGREGELAAVLGGLKTRDTELVKGFQTLRRYFDMLMNEETS